MKPWKQSLPEAPPGLSKLEALRREKALRRLDWFVLEFWNEVEPQRLIWNWHIAVFCWHLMAVTFKLIPRLLFTTIPRSAKSRVMTMFWPGWEFARGCKSRFLVTGNDQELMIELSVECRRLIKSEKFQRWFPHVEIEDDQDTKKKIDIKGGARRQITSVGTKTTGKGGTHLVGDDLHDAHDSKNAFRTNAHWFFATFMATRGDPTGFCVVLGCQMLDPEDAANQIVKKQLKFWTWLCLPLYYDPARPCVTIPLPFIEEWVAEHGEDTPWFDSRKPGEGLWDEVYGKERVEQIRASLSEREFDAQFQQLARKREGGVWKEEWLEEFRILEFEKVKRFVTSTDSPFKSKQRSKTGDPDYFAQAVYAEVERVIQTGDPDNPIKRVLDYYVLGCVNKQIGYPDMKKEFRSFVDYWDAILGGAIALHLIEDKANGSAIIEDLSPEYPLIDEYDPGRISKELRFELVAPTIKARRLYFPSEDGAKILMGGKVMHALDLEFLPKMKKQFTTIPNTDDGHDDMADTFAQLDLHNRYGNTDPDPIGEIAAPSIDVFTVERRRRF